MTAMHCAAWGGWPEVVSVLAGRGGQVNAVSSVGQTPLHKAAQHGGHYVVEIPQEYVADLKPTTRMPKFPFSFAHVPFRGANWTELGSLAVTRRLLSLGADPWMRDHGDETAEEMAARYNRWETMELLRRVMQLDQDGNAPHEYRDGKPPPSAWLSEISPEVHKERQEWVLAERKRIREEEVAQNEEARDLRRQGYIAAGLPQAALDEIDLDELYRETIGDMERMVAEGAVTVDANGQISGLPNDAMAREIDIIKNMSARYARTATAEEMREAEEEATSMWEAILRDDRTPAWMRRGLGQEEQER